MEATDLQDHISNQYNQELEEIRTRVLKMGGLVEELLDTAITGLLKSDSALCVQAIEDDTKVNDAELEIDEECTRILALRHPTASDLRLILSVIKTITDLERIGDESEKIGFLGKRLISEGEFPKRIKRNVKHLSRLVKNNLRDVLNAFARSDGEAALDVIKNDAEIDEYYESMLREQLTYMMEDPRMIRSSMEVMWVARALERIGDHAKNIAEHVIYMLLGHDIRHLEISKHKDFSTLADKLQSP
ncbi:MAG: phosphate signaling complex protein PhoU [Gammaproteobacteria bacterium]|nr:phosphate signaling complex protein PhoU [Gammaproteobacteria bacterium]NNM13395.1 phosphate signaling complex protein PhoU [Gammaproteobacteria bacterium]